MNLDVLEKLNQLLMNISEAERPLIEESLGKFIHDPDAFEIVAKLLNGLNPEQLEVVAHPIDGPPTLVLGGAGSGKTATLTRRLAFLVLSGVAPDQIFAVTFTRKAAREMAERTKLLFHMLKETASEPYRSWLEQVTIEIENAWITTFHSAGLKMLRDDPFGNGENLLGLDRGAHSRIIDEEERNSILISLVRDYESEEIRPENIGSIISNAKGAFVYPEGFHHTVKTRNDEIASLVYPKYQAELERRGLLDFDDLIFKVYELFEKHPEILEHYQTRFQTLLIDEYQDTNLSQYLIGMLLAKSHRRIMAVGDDDQSIYGWRGAEVTNLTRFLADYPDVKIVKLVRNYRSDAIILHAANSIWRDKPEELRKTLICAKSGGEHEAERIRMVTAESEEDEARYIASEIVESLGAGYDAVEIAILVRSHYLLAPIVGVLEEYGIPWAQAGAIKSLARPEVLGIVSMMEIAALTARRIANPAQWHVGDLESLNYAVSQAVTSPCYDCPAEVLSDLGSIPDPSSLLIDESARADAARFLDKRLHYALDHIAAVARELLLDPEVWKPTALFDRLVRIVPPVTNFDEDDPGWRALRRMRGVAEIAELRRAVNPHELILMFTDEIRARAGLLPDEGQSTEKDSLAPAAVQLMTLHAAKGLEFEIVFLAGVEDGILPVRRRKDEESAADAEFRLGEEKRLFYVGVSRAKKRLHITRCRKRTSGFGERETAPSPFLELIPKELTVDVKLG